MALTDDYIPKNLNTNKVTTPISRTEQIEIEYYILQRELLDLLATLGAIYVVAGIICLLTSLYAHSICFFIFILFTSLFVRREYKKYESLMIREILSL